MNNVNSYARDALVWCNAFYSDVLGKVEVPSKVAFENSLFLVYPDLWDEVAKYAYLPNGRLRKPYIDYHLAEQKKNLDC